jgi:hypothetical protein
LPAFKYSSDSNFILAECDARHSSWHFGSSPRLTFDITEETITRNEKRDKSIKKTSFFEKSFLSTG